MFENCHRYRHWRSLAARYLALPGTLGLALRRNRRPRYSGPERSVPRGAHVARVTGAYGATTGVLFLEDIIEELIGEVQDAASA